jgi:hypothetical protein
MIKALITGLILVLAMILITPVYACPPRDVTGQDNSKYTNIDVETLKKFQKETLPLRDELITKRFEIRRERSKETPDRDRIATLQKEIIDIRTKIKKKADELGLPADVWEKSGRGMSKNKGMRGEGCGYSKNR